MKELKFKSDLLVPFDSEGNQLGHDYSVSSWETNKIFYDELEFLEFSLGRSSVKALFKSVSTGKEYEMFLSDFELLVKNEIIWVGRFKNTFHFEKRGANWGIVPHLGRVFNA